MCTCYALTVVTVAKLPLCVRRWVYAPIVTHLFFFQDLEALFIYYDHDGDAEVDWDDFLLALRVSHLITCGSASLTGS